MEKLLQGVDFSELGGPAMATLSLISTVRLGKNIFEEM
jgi:hypothetical protein